MVTKAYPPQFKAVAVALYRSRPGATITEVAHGLGVSRATLRTWIRIDDSRRARGPPPLKSPAWSRRTGSCARVSPSWRKLGRSCARRPPASREK
ncbi:transposase [Nocardiopsis mwathae]|uniref:transposase n=1 Tax=Nocardiopsis mwathae TaxID=1472723 RepID=UPI00160D02EC|nr:transposase [Nocardiopsis mwathae]